MNPSPFQITPEGLQAQNNTIRLLLSPLHGPLRFEDGALTEETEYNLLVHHLKGSTDFELTLNGEPAQPPAYLQNDATLWGRLNTGDRPGRIRFQITSNQTELFCADLSIRPSKLDYETDYYIMRSDLEAICRTLTFAPPRFARTETQIHSGENTPLEFLQIAGQHLVRLRHLLSAICKHPNRKLATNIQYPSVSHAKGHDPESIAYLLRTPAVWTPLSDHARLTPLPIPGRRIGYTRLRETHRQPDLHTPANCHLVAFLTRIYTRANTLVQTLPKTNPYHTLCTQIRTHLGHVLQTPPLHEISPAQPGDPFPTHLDPRYTAAFTLCRDLLKTLTPCKGGPFDLSYRDTPTLYEYWVWLTFVQTFLNAGFALNGKIDCMKLSPNTLTFHLQQGETAAIQLIKDRWRLRLLYNPTYTTAQGHTLTHDLRPDVVVEVHAPSGKRHVHAFDAKYRRETASHPFWIPLSEDIDKMHAYRDAIGQVTPKRFTRTLQSAIVLFPAPSDKRYRSHRFYKSLSHGIGALPLLPGDPKTLQEFQTFLTNHLLKK